MTLCECGGGEGGGRFSETSYVKEGSAIPHLKALSTHSVWVKTVFKNVHLVFDPGIRIPDIVVVYYIYLSPQAPQ